MKRELRWANIPKYVPISMFPKHLPISIFPKHVPISIFPKHLPILFFRSMYQFQQDCSYEKKSVMEAG